MQMNTRCTRQRAPAVGLRPAGSRCRRALTADTDGPYSGLMPQDNTRELLDQELGRLESRIRELTELCAKLRRDNHSLGERLESLSGERAGLLAKSEHVRGRVEAIITRLKSLEESA
ncbi:MAG: TIGR02449 family protein [Gammaproteobacteria bacterium]